MTVPIKQENPLISELVLNALRLELPAVYEKIHEITNVILELDEQTWKQQSPFILELQDDIVKNLCQLFKEKVAGFTSPKKISSSERIAPPVNFTAKIVRNQRNSNPLSMKTKSDSFLMVKPSSESLFSSSNFEKKGIAEESENEEAEEDEEQEGEEENHEEEEDANYNDLPEAEDSLAPAESEDVDLEFLYPDRDSESTSQHHKQSSSNDVFDSANQKPLSNNPFDNFGNFDAFDDSSFASDPTAITKSKSTDPFDSLNVLPLKSASSHYSSAIAEESSFYNPFYFREQDKKKVHHFSCPICLNTKSAIDGSIEMQNCSHRFCFPCMRQYLTSKINSREIKDTQLICPSGKNCCEKISLTMIQGVVDTVTWEKYQEYSTQSLMEYECYYGLGLRCPNHLCKNIFFFESLEEKKQSLEDKDNGYNFYCNPRLNGCNQTFCISCKAVFSQVAPSHLPYSCKEYATRLLNHPDERQRYEIWKKLFTLTPNSHDGQFQQLIAKEGLRSCPVCSVMIQKTEGCDHMHCTLCNCNFCYVCGKFNQHNPIKRGDCGPKHGDKNWSYPDDL
jgi:hypothetical protein